MEYTKHNFKSGEKLYASQLNEMDEQIAANAEAIDDLTQRVDSLTNQDEDIIEYELFSYDKANQHGNKVSDLVKAIYYENGKEEFLKQIKDMSILRIGRYSAGGYTVCVIRYVYNDTEYSTELQNTSIAGEIWGSLARPDEVYGEKIHVVLQDGVDLNDVDSDKYLFTPYPTYNMVNNMYLQHLFEDNNSGGTNDTNGKYVSTQHFDEVTGEINNEINKIKIEVFPYGNYEQLPSNTDAVLYGDKIYVDGELHMFTGEMFEKYYCSGEQYDGEVDVDVAIIGGGTGGVASAYSFIGKGFSVALIEKEEKLGGVACNGGVITWIEGLNTPMLESVFNDMAAQSLATGIFENSWLPQKFSGISGSSLIFDPSGMSEKYKTDLTQDNITLYTGATFENVYEKIGDSIKSIIIRHNGAPIKVNARVFIDASTDLSLVRSVGTRGTDFEFGRDYQSKYNESLAMTSGDTNYLNEPSYFFELSLESDDTELLNSITTVYRDGNSVVAPSYIAADGYVFNSPGGKRICNPMNGAGMQGFEKLKKGTAQYSKELRKRTLEFWKFIKLNLILADERGEAEWKTWATSKKNLGFTGFAEIISDRETYRAICDEMLTQNDLSVLVENANHTVAVGSHNIDFHVTNGLNTSAIKQFNDNDLKPYGIKYESMIPISLNNCFVASKCFGASQMAYASARINKVINQLGWCAGNAALIFLEDNLTDVRDVDITKLNSIGYTDFENRLNILLAKMKQ